MEQFGIPDAATLLRQVTADKRDMLVEDTFYERFMGFIHAIQWTEVSALDSGPYRYYCPSVSRDKLAALAHRDNVIPRYTMGPDYCCAAQ